MLCQRCSAGSAGPRGWGHLWGRGALDLRGVRAPRHAAGQLHPDTWKLHASTWKLHSATWELRSAAWKLHPIPQKRSSCTLSLCFFSHPLFFLQKGQLHPASWQLHPAAWELHPATWKPWSCTRILSFFLSS